MGNLFEDTPARGDSIGRSSVSPVLVAVSPSKRGVDPFPTAQRSPSIVEQSLASSQQFLYELNASAPADAMPAPAPTTRPLSGHLSARAAVSTPDASKPPVSARSGGKVGATPRGLAVAGQVTVGEEPRSKLQAERDSPSKEQEPSHSIVSRLPDDEEDDEYSDDRFLPDDGTPSSSAKASPRVQAAAAAAVKPSPRWNDMGSPLKPSAVHTIPEIPDDGEDGEDSGYEDDAWIPAEDDAGDVGTPRKL